MKKCLVHCPGSHKDGLHLQGTQLSQHSACSALPFQGWSQDCGHTEQGAHFGRRKRSTALVCALAFRRKLTLLAPPFFWKSLKNFPPWSQSSRTKPPHFYPRCSGGEHSCGRPRGHPGCPTWPWRLKGTGC